MNRLETLCTKNDQLALQVEYVKKTNEKDIYLKEREGERERERENLMTLILNIYDHVWLCTYSFVRVTT